MQLFQKSKPIGKKLLSFCTSSIHNNLNKLVIDPRKLHQIEKYRIGPPFEIEKKKYTKR